MTLTEQSSTLEHFETLAEKMPETWFCNTFLQCRADRCWKEWSLRTPLTSDDYDEIAALLGWEYEVTRMESEIAGGMIEYNVMDWEYIIRPVYNVRKCIYTASRYKSKSLASEAAMCSIIREVCK